MSKRRILYAAVGYLGFVWSIAILGSGKPFDALVMLTVSGLLVHESYREEWKR